MKINKDNLIIAIDGFSSSGKSTFAKAIANKLNYIYIDSGAMYRAVTLAFIKNNAFDGEKIKENLIKNIIGSLDIDFRLTKDNKYITFLNGQNVENEIRDINVSEKVSIVSKLPQVRDKLVELQRKIGSKGGIVMDGRDIGTVVFPNADIKIFLTADPKIRALRRFNELKEKGLDISLEQIEKNILLRDITDQTREISPLKKAEDAIILDNSYMTFDEQMEWFDNIMKKYV